jgi:hypothetical protein
MKLNNYIFLRNLTQLKLFKIFYLFIYIIMSYPTRKYCIIDFAEVESIPVDFDAVLETNAETLRKTLDGTKTFIKYEGDQPAFLSGKTEYSHSEILTILRGSDWSFHMGTIDISGISNMATVGETKAAQTVSMTGASSVANHSFTWEAKDTDGNITTDIVFSDAASSTTDITYNAEGVFEITITVSETTYGYDNIVTEKIEVIVTAA